MTIPGSPGIPFDWEIYVADCDTLSQYAKSILDLAVKMEAIANDSEADYSARTGALITLMALRRKFGLVEQAWGIRGCPGSLPGPMPGGVVEEQWPPQFPY